MESEEFRKACALKASMTPSSISAIKRVLDRDRGASIGSMFYWAASPQGSNYWAYKHDSMENSLTEEDYEFLRWLIRPEILDKGE